MEIRIKRVYENPDDEDGCRILVDRLWPRGISKEKAKIDFWPKDLAPSDELRHWYDHDPEKWSEFKSRYFEELNENQDLAKELMDRISRQRVAFVYGAKEERLNNAVALREYLRSHVVE